MLIRVSMMQHEQKNRTSRVAAIVQNSLISIYRILTRQRKMGFYEAKCCSFCDTPYAIIKEKQKLIPMKVVEFPSVTPWVCQLCGGLLNKSNGSTRVVKWVPYVRFHGGIWVSIPTARVLDTPTE